MNDIFQWVATHPIHMASFMVAETIFVFSFVILYGIKQIRRGR
jgi:hypothetical protein